MNWAREIPTTVCALLWGAFGAAKLLAPHPRGLAVGSWQLGPATGTVVGAVELALAIGLLFWAKQRRLLLCVSLGFLVAAMWLSLKYAKPACGCLGAAVISHKQHLALLGTMLFATGMALLLPGRGARAVSESAEGLGEV